MIRIGGTAYRLHPLFVLLMVLSVLTGYLPEMLTLFGVVTIHELGHVACAKSFGWRVRQVQLLPFGGVAVVDESSNVPAWEEFSVAICGPLQNAWMAGFAYLMVQAGWGDPEYWTYFLQANVMIGLFNMLPALPLDGGKILQSILSYAVSYHRAMTFTLYLSLLISVMTVSAALLLYTGGGIQLNMLVIGIFLFYMNWYGYKHLPFQFLRFLMHREKRSIRFMEQGSLPTPLLVPSDARPMDVFRRFMREKHHLLYIVGRTGQILRIMPEAGLLRTYLSAILPPGKSEDERGNTRPPQAPKIG